MLLRKGYCASKSGAGDASKGAVPLLLPLCCVADAFVPPPLGRPMEMTSRNPVSRKRTVIETAAVVSITRLADMSKPSSHSRSPPISAVAIRASPRCPPRRPTRASSSRRMALCASSSRTSSRSSRRLSTHCASRRRTMLDPRLGQSRRWPSGQSENASRRRLGVWRDWRMKGGEGNMRRRSCGDIRRSRRSA